MLQQWGTGKALNTVNLSLTYENYYVANITIFHDSYNGNALVGNFYIDSTKTTLSSFWAYAGYRSTSIQQHPYDIYYHTIGY